MTEFPSSSSLLDSSCSATLTKTQQTTFSAPHLRLMSHLSSLHLVASSHHHHSHTQYLHRSRSYPLLLQVTTTASQPPSHTSITTYRRTLQCIRATRPCLTCVTMFLRNSAAVIRYPSSLCASVSVVRSYHLSCRTYSPIVVCPWCFRSTDNRCSEL